jgi:Icc protein
MRPRWMRIAFVCLSLLSLWGSSAITRGNDLKPLLTLGVISDIHIQAWDGLSQRKLRRALNDLDHQQPAMDALVIVGDLTNGQPADYTALTNIMLEQPRPPVFYLIGNHEYYKAWYDQAGRYRPGSFPNGESEAAAQERFRQFTKTPHLYDDRWVNGVHLLFMGSEHYRQSDAANGEDAVLSAEQLTWLTATLAAHPARQPILLFLHQPPDQVVQRTQLAAILRNHPNLVLFSGHTHWQLQSRFHTQLDGYHLVNTSSVVQPYGPDDRPLPGDESEGLIVKVYANHLVVQGRDFVRHQWRSVFSLAFNGAAN